MTNLEFCRKQRKSEVPKFLAVLKAAAAGPSRLPARPEGPHRGRAGLGPRGGKRRPS